jgi:hypothetical protein
VDEGIASELQKALDTAAEQEAKARRFALLQLFVMMEVDACTHTPNRAEEEAKSQMEIIKMLMQEKESMEMKRYMARRARLFLFCLTFLLPAAQQGAGQCPHGAGQAVPARRKVPA